MKIVVTGGAGFIGSVLVPRLLAEGHRVHVVDSLLFGAHGILSLFLTPGFSFAKVDVRDRAALAPELEGADVIVHLAALVGYPLCKKLPRDATEVNVQGTRNVVELAPADARLIYASTGSNYGEVEGVCTENTPLNPLSHYGRTKTEAERIVLERPPSVSLRFATAFGISPRLRLDLMINDFAWQAIHHRYLVVYEKHFRRTFLHVSDIAGAIAHVIDSWDRVSWPVYNVGQDTLNFTKADIVGLLQDRLDFLVHFAEIGQDEDRRNYEVDYTRIQQTGFLTQVDIGRGLDELIGALRLLPLHNPYSNV